MDDRSELEKSWEFEIAREEAREVADECLAIVTTALEDAQVGVGRVLWKKACEERLDRIADAPLIDAIAAVEPRLSRATQYRAIAVFLQAPYLPEQTRGLLGPTRLYELLRIPNDHIAKKALALRAAQSNMPIEELRLEVDRILGVEPKEARGQTVGSHLGTLSRSVKTLQRRVARYVPVDKRDLDKQKSRVAALIAALQGVAAGLDRVVVPGD
jgi:hypothetical protein